MTTAIPAGFGDILQEYGIMTPAGMDGSRGDGAVLGGVQGGWQHRVGITPRAGDGPIMEDTGGGLPTLRDQGGMITAGESLLLLGVRPICLALIPLLEEARFTHLPAALFLLLLRLPDGRLPLLQVVGDRSLHRLSAPLRVPVQVCRAGVRAESEPPAVSLAPAKVCGTKTFWS